MLTLIKDAISTGEGSEVAIIPGSDTGQTSHSFQIVTNGSPTALTVSILGTIDGVNYSCVLEHEFTAAEITEGSALVHLINKAVAQVKVSIDVLTGGVSPTVSVYYLKGPRSV